MQAASPDQDVDKSSPGAVRRGMKRASYAIDSTQENSQSWGIKGFTQYLNGEVLPNQPLTGAL